MAKTQTVWGLDVGRCALKALRLRASGDGDVQVVGHDYIEHARILTQPDADRSELIRTALEQFLSRNDTSKDDVVVSVPGQHTLARFTKLPPVAPKRIPDIVRYEADQQIPFDMDEVIWDYQTFQEEGLPDLEVGIFAMKRELLREHLLHFEQAAIEPIAVQCGPLAVYNAAQYDGLLGSETTILLDIGAENTDLIIATPHSFWTRTVPIGGNKFTEALVKSFKLSFSKAEQLKRTADSSKYARQIFQAMRPVFADLVQELQRSVGFYSATHRDASVEKVLCFGNGSKLPGLQKYLQQNLSLTVEKLGTFKRATGPVDGALKDNFPGYAVAYGLALQGLDLGKVSSNLLPRELAKQLVWRKKKPAFAAGAACILLAGALVWFRYSADMRAMAEGQTAPAPQVGSIADAWNLIDQGPGAQLPPRARARALLEAGNRLRQQFNDLLNEGVVEREQTEHLIQIHRNKAVVPAILKAIHESIPTPPGPLAEATTAEEYVAKVKNAGPRNERKELYLAELQMDYEQDVNRLIWPRPEISAPDPINDPDTPLSAIKIKLICRTPYKDAARFIDESFVSSLRNNGRRPNQGFYFDRVYIMQGMKIDIVTEGSGPGPGPGPARPRIGGIGGAPRGASESGANLDPLTNEPMDDDWQFEIWIDAVLEDFPEAQGDENRGDGE